MTDKEIFEMYMNGLVELNFEQCMKAVGILYYQNSEYAIDKDIEANFLIGNYEYVTYLYESNKSKERVIENDEYYYASLALCGRFPKLRRELRKTEKNPISWYGAAYLQNIIIRNNERIDRKYHSKSYENTAFRRLNVEDVIRELINIYEMQIELEEAYQGDKEEIKKRYKQITDKMQNINISSEYIGSIKTCVSNYSVINPLDIYCFFCQVFKSEGINKRGEKVTFTELRDILSLFELLRRLKLYSELIKQVVLLDDIVFDSISRQNRTAATYLKEVYFELKYNDSIGSTEKESVCRKCEEQLELYFPELLNEGNDYYKRSTVYSLLSETTKPMFRAAEWQYKAVMEDLNYGFRDAGMLCLSYIRLLELEVNTRLLSIIRLHFDVIYEKYEANKPSNNDSNAKKKSFNYKWGIVKTINPATTDKEQKGLTAGEWGAFLNLLYNENNKNSKDEVYLAFFQVLKEFALNKQGIEALNNGEFAKVFDQDTIVDKYRNPPAHTRYVTLDVARECKQYVENKLIFLEGLFR